MLARLTMVWVKVRDSLWFLPGVLTLAAAGIAVALTEAERGGDLLPELGPSWIFAGRAEGARGVLSAIAGGLITVTGVVFSVTIVALQLASSQFTPRVLRNFTADRANQLVLGVFIGTFAYTILVLRTIYGGADGEEGFVPRVAVTGAVLLVMVSIGCLIFFISHAARSIQVSAILDRVAMETLRDVQRLFPDQVGHADEVEVPDPRPPEHDSAPVTAAESGYLQAVDSAALFQLGERGGRVIAMVPQMGDFVVAGEALASVAPPEAVDDELVAGVRTAFVLGPERTPEQDVEFGIIEISDIAVKALSPGINDPTTAMHCIDRLGEILLAFGARRPPRARRTEHGVVHFIARYTTFERALGLAFDQIAHFGASNPAIPKRLLNVLGKLEALLPERHHGTVRAQVDAVLRLSRGALDDPAHAAAVERAAGPAQRAEGADLAPRGD
ncbi:MAG TPA: DUF2254 domain-containing protein [Longimicrobiaceae bacterium]|nr:DUF2254 domain-containing protein [Longimicrobiaceae bacterium]